MKNLNFVIVFALLLSGQLVFGQKVEVNTEKSNIEWLGKKIGGQHDGNIKLSNGSFEIEDNMIVAGSFVVDMTTITNNDLKDDGYKQKLVGHLKSDDFFGVEAHPTASIVITNSSKFKKGKATVAGDITIKGKTESISFVVVREGNEFGAKIEIDRSKFDVRYGSKSFFKNIGDKAIDDIFILDVKLVVN